MDLHRLIYISSGRRKFGDEELRDILDVSRTNNAEIDVTGMLLYLDGNFLQLLEGGRDDVEALYERIALDKRHSGAIVLSRAEVAERSFPDWAMGLKMLNPEKHGDLAGVFKLGPDTVGARMQPTGDALAEKMVSTFLQVNA